MKRVVVTGIGAVTPIGNNVNDFWSNLINGKSGAAPITRFDSSQFKTRFACEVKDFDPSIAMGKTEIRKTDLFIQFAMVAANECMKDASIDLEKIDKSRIGVIWGSGMGGMMTYEDGMLDFYKNNLNPRFSPMFIPKIIPNITSGHIAIKYHMQGPSYSIAAACTSSNNAIIDAFNYIRIGDADMMMAGGSEAPIYFGPVGGFSSMKALSEYNENPQIASRPFDKSRDGFVLGEGSGALMLESLDHALARGANIYCELASYGMASDAFHITAPHPDGEGAIIAMKQALSKAGLTIYDIDYINAHATSTPLGDISECKAINAVFNDALKGINISATKSMTGHLMGAAGVVEAIATIKSITDSIIPPTINFTELDGLLPVDLNITPNVSAQRTVNFALNNTFGFGGHIASTLFKKFKN